MSVLTEVEEHGTDLGPSREIEFDNDDAVTNTAGIRAGMTFSAARGGHLPGC